VQNGPDFTMINPESSGGLSPWSFNVSVDSAARQRPRGFMHRSRPLSRRREGHVKGSRA
jgi:hypothetical protein